MVGAGASVIHAVCEQSEIGPEATVGPYTRLRPGSRLGRGARAGSFVEMKNAVVGEGTKVPHLTYVGDADIGAGSNIGAATVFVNYDGVAKHRTRVGDQVRIGSDTMLVAPVEIGDGAYTAAGSVITQDVPPGALGIGRAGQRNIPGWVTRRRPGTAPAAAAEAALSEGARPRGPVRRRQRKKTRPSRRGKPNERHPGGQREADDPRLRAGLSELAEEVAACLGIEPTPSKLFDFANGEIFVRFLDSVRGCDVFVLQSHTAPINQWIMEHLIMVDALKRASAKRITVVTPFFGYARQDKKSRGREPISARLMADLFLTAGARPDHGRGPAHRADPGLLRRPGGPPVRAAHPGRLHRGQAGPEPGHGGRPGRGPGPDVRALDRPARRPRWPSSTSAGTRTWPTRSRCSRSSARSPAGPASWSTT